MAKQFLDYSGLVLYNQKIKEYVDSKGISGEGIEMINTYLDLPDDASIAYVKEDVTVDGVLHPKGLYVNGISGWELAANAVAEPQTIEDDDINGLF